mmetsp:Transcript_412/g.935  ORF Transcript_412/g.935 Transcript_412/m.935 type:complete len:202 (-) Transcript_412:29-634(-)
MKIQSVLALLSLAVPPSQAFVPKSSPTTTSLALRAESETSFVDSVQKAFEIAQASNSEGYGFKQIVADVLAGDDFDKEAVAQEIEETIASAPCVMYTWENSPSCKKAVDAFKVIGATPKIVRLDDPFDEGNKVRAVLGRKVGRTSVPFVFVDGKYIGGFDGGLEGNPDASGMIDLAFQGKLREMLTEAGAMDSAPEPVASE